MRSLWGQIGRLGCDCRCYNCLEEKHVLVRRMSTVFARIRSGQAIPRIYQELADLHSQGWRQHQIRHKSDENTQSLWAKDWKHTAQATVGVEVFKKNERSEVLATAASELRSLKIGHWSVDDVVKYEPRPGGLQPPRVASTTSADPHFIPPQSPWARDDAKRKAYMSLWTAKKIAKMETCIALLVVRICRLTDLHSQWPSNLIVLPEAFRPFAKLTPAEQLELEAELQFRLEVLRNKHGKVGSHNPPAPSEGLLRFLPSYQQFEDGSHHELLRDLNASLVELIDAHHKKQLTFLALLVKMCHNLLVSSCPPNLQSINLLLLAFNNMGRQDEHLHARYVAMDLLVEICRTVKIRPNEITCATILSCYRRRGMKQSFSAFILAMRAAGFESLMYTNELSPTKENAARLSPTHDHEKIFKQAVYPSAMVFSEIIKGVLRFCSISDALDICDEFTAKEWGYDWSCLYELLHACISERDFDAGLRVWSRIVAFRGMEKDAPNKVYAAMLALCVTCKRQDMFDEVLRFASHTKAQLKNGANELQLRALKIADAEVRKEGAEEKVYELRKPAMERVAYMNELRELLLDPKVRRNMFFKQVRRNEDPNALVLADEYLELDVEASELKDESPDGMAAFEWEREGSSIEEQPVDVGADLRKNSASRQDREDWADSPMEQESDFIQPSPVFRFVASKH